MNVFRNKLWLGIAVLATSTSTGLRAGDAAPTTAEESVVPVPVRTLAPICGIPFQDNMVLQQKIPLPVWGTTLPGAKVSLTFDQQVKTGVADETGRWRVVLEPMTAVKLASVHDAPAGLVMTITCEKDGETAVKEICNILVGEVWLGAGQSNMAGAIRSGSPRLYPPGPETVANYPALRQLASPGGGPWAVCTLEGVSVFKRVCFFFSNRLQGDILVPVGLINASVGGSSIESWLNQEPYAIGGNYSKLIDPLVGFGLRGVIWYQGESNEKDRRAYQPKLESLITGWRKVWNQTGVEGGPHRDFSFYFVQLPGIGKSSLDNPAGGDGRAEIRQAFANALALPNTGMAVAYDVGAEGEHPPNKLDTGYRLARVALHKDYGFTNVSLSPLYKSHKIEGSSIRIVFDSVPNGLMIALKEGMNAPVPTPEAKLEWLAIQAKDGSWHWADGRIDGADLVVSSASVKEPVAVRYAYTQHPRGHLLYDADGMPVAPFSTCGYGDK